jgi:hypothetical protein
MTLVTKKQTHQANTTLELDETMTMRARDLPGLSDLHSSNKRLFGTSAAIAKSPCIVVDFPPFLTFAVRFGLSENMAEKARQEH